MARFLGLILLTCLHLQCIAQDYPKHTQTLDFGAYWHQGLAELTSYNLEQARYGEIHTGHAVLIFVTEDFSREKHVKLDNPSDAERDKVNVLKLNFTKKFLTGIYPYSMMASIFTAVDIQKEKPVTYKISASSQEWCGQTFLQLNKTTSGYHWNQFSYFESEGDNEGKVEGAWLEDEIWNSIRLNPLTLPVGPIKVIPGAFYLRLGHQAIDILNAVAILNESENGEMVYTLTYPDDQRSLKIFFKKNFPHEIQGWEEEHSSGYGSNAKILTTKATLNKRIQLDYWTKNGLDDRRIRTQLGLIDP